MPESVAPGMRCPRCRDATLDALTTGDGVSVGFCSRCRGMWCPREQLAPLIGVPADHPRLLWARRGVPLAGNHCPACDEGSLRSLHIGSTDEIRLEECAMCGGTWINGGLLPELRSQLSVTAKSTAPPPRRSSVVPAAGRPPTVPPPPRLPSMTATTPRPPSVAPTPRPPSVAPGPRPPSIAPTPRPPSVAPGPRPPSIAPTPRPPSIAPTPRPPSVAPGPRPPSVAPAALPASVAPPAPEPVRTERITKILADDGPLLQGFAVPVALSLGLLSSQLPFAEQIHALGVARGLHALGHAAVAWLGGFPASPLPFFTVPWEYRSAVVVFLLFGALAAALYVSVRRRRLALAALAGVLLALEATLTLIVPGATCRVWITFSGCAGELVLGALLMVGFHYRLSDRIRWDLVRYLALLLGAVALVGALGMWSRAGEDLRLLPVEIALGGRRDVDGDLRQLMDLWGFAPEALVRAYRALGHVCLAVVGAHYVVFLARAIKKARAARVRFSETSPSPRS